MTTDTWTYDAAKAQAWADATAELRKDLKVEATAKAEAELRKERGSKKWTATQDKAVANYAKGIVLRKLASMPEYNGVENHGYSDPIWGQGAAAVTTTTEAPSEDLTSLAEWLAEQTWSEFAQSLASQFKNKGSLSPKQIASAKSMKAKTEASRKAREQKAQISSKTTGLDLSELPSGYYAVPNGDTRLKVRVARSKSGKWQGWTFVSDGAAYGQRKNYGRQAPSGKYQGDIASELEAIMADPKEATMAYGRLTGTCGSCGRMLEDEDSIAKGIGPICEGKF